jgi:isoaspartyl peptidase/L-asparaginase-like protein (Ntn-hydrolase superfamily)
MNTSRRKFFAQTASAVAAGALVPTTRGADTTPARSAGEQPLIISTWPFGQAANAEALKTLLAGGSPLDAVEQGIRLTESSANPSVGLGGLPNAAGVVQLDACIMQGPGHRAGSVAGIEGIRHPITAARRVMEKTPHVMLVGEGARLFALEEGLESVSTDSVARHEAWQMKRRADKGKAGEPAAAPSGNHDTIALLVLGPDGSLAGGCSTSGWGGKLPGRVGDSPIIGSGLYVDNQVGAAGATGLGENVMRYCGSFLVVELMRQGRHPAEACLEALRRMAAMDAKGTAISVSFIAVDRQGRHGSASAGQTFQYAVTTRGATRLVDSPGLGALAPVPEGGNRR